MNIYRTGLLLVAATLLASPSIALGITLGHVDTFEDGTKQGWNAFKFDVGGPPAGGPAGSSDHYLHIITVSSGGATSLQATNNLQWSGNYSAAGVSSIEMDLRNNTISSIADMLSIRIAIVGVSDSPKVGYSSTTPIKVPQDGQWHHVSFSLASDAMTAIGSPSPLASELPNVGQLIIVNSISRVYLATASHSAISTSTTFEQFPSHHRSAFCIRESLASLCCIGIGSSS